MPVISAEWRRARRRYRCEAVIPYATGDCRRSVQLGEAYLRAYGMGVVGDPPFVIRACENCARKWIESTPEIARKVKPLSKRPPGGRKWSRALVIEKILERRRRGKPLNAQAVRTDDLALYMAAVNHFRARGWEKALRAAGIDPASVYLRRQRGRVA